MLSQHVADLMSTMNTHEDKSIEMEESGACSALVVSLMAQKQISFETVIPDKIIVVDKSKAKAKNKKTAVSKPSDSDAEEEALIEETEKQREKENTTTGSCFKFGCLCCLMTPCLRKDIQCHT